MPVVQRVVTVQGPSEHNLQFFDTIDSRATSAAQLLAPGYEVGDALIVIATRPHWDAIEQRLLDLGVPVKSAIARGQLFVRDVGEVLALLRPQGVMDSQMFEDHVGSLMRTLAGRPGIRVYCEIVDLLACEGDTTGVLGLEALWTGLARTIPFRMLCAYASPPFASGTLREALDSICQIHTAVCAHEADPLGAWLLGQVQPDASVIP